jgi:tripartite-type tricarboxylate transporter receptor subunit TctC
MNDPVPVFRMNSLTKRALAAALGVICAAGAAVFGAAAATAAYPERPIRIVIPNPAGSNSDLIMRQLAPGLSDQIKQNFVIDNRPGGSGVIANNVVRLAAPDGYTVLFGTATNLAGTAAGIKMEYDPIKEFSSIGLIATLPYVLVVNNSLPVKTVRELVDYVKARPGKISYAATPGGSLYAGALFERVAQVVVTAVPYNSGPQAMTSIINGDVSFMFYPYQALSSQIKANRMRALATTATSRPSWLSNVPTMIEAGYRDFDLATFVGLYVPHKTPRDVITVFSRALNAALKDPELQAKYSEAGTVVMPMTPEATDRFTAAAVRKFRELEKMTGAKGN